ncbi:MAG: DEAD/DEAH box helicase [Flavobacteriaceae bacterium]|nr:MAG: DEAD/DEAH box helicase [Flavobacteriaceae bacterium]
MVNTFKNLGVPKKYIEALEALGITEPTPIQIETLGYLLKESGDFVGQAQTGTGKTLAFSIPILSKINPQSSQIQALILTPTRELAKQISAHIFKYTKFSEKIFCEAVFGGEQIDKQIKNLSRTTHILVGTPGRIEELIKRKVLDLSQIKTLVLDEADEMLSLGFESEIKKVFVHLPQEKNTWLFSATMPQNLKLLITNHLRDNPKTVLLSQKSVVNPGIEHQYVKCTEEDRDFFIFTFLRAMGKKRGILFCRTKSDALALCVSLKEKGIVSEVLHGDMTQKERDKMMRAIASDKNSILITTDVFARGIDLLDLAYVVHHKLPKENDYYIHRSGRTARAGKKGISIAFCTQRDLKRLYEIENALKIRFLQIK